MKNFKKRAPLLGILALIVVSLIGGTFAYFTQTQTASNFLEASEYNSAVSETFTPPQDGNFTPGVEYEKVVGVKNTGSVGMLVRIKYEEKWGGTTVPFALTDFKDPASFDPDGAGLLPSDMYYDSALTPSVVLKEAGLTTTNVNGDWLYGGDGYYYFMAELLPGESTDNFIDSIMLKNSSMTSVTLYDVVVWDDSEETYVDYLDQTAAQVDAITLATGDYISSKVVNTTFDMTNTGLYELTFTVETIQTVTEALATWSPTTTDLLTTLEGFLDTP